MLPSSAKAKQASSVMPTPTTHTVRKSQGCRVLMAMFLAVRKMPEPMIPPASSRMESVRESPRTSLASLDNRLTAHPCGLDIILFPLLPSRACLGRHDHLIRVRIRVRRGELDGETALPPRR